MEPPPKKRRLSHDGAKTADKQALPLSLSHPVSPPRTKRSRLQVAPAHGTVQASSSSQGPSDEKVFKSPFQLTWIRDLPDKANVDAVTLRDILEDPLIAEVWNFNYLHDIDFLKGSLDEDVRDTIKVHLVHGFWKSEDPNRSLLRVSAWLDLASTVID